MNQKKIKEILEDSDRLGPGVKMKESVSMSKEETDRIYAQSGLQMVSIRLPNEVVEKLKILAQKDGIKYQPFVRRLLIQYIKNESVKKSTPPVTEARIRQIFDEEYKRKRKRA